VKTRIKKSILQEASDIVDERSEERTRAYGPFIDSVNKMAEFYNASLPSDMQDQRVTPDRMYIAMAALKLSRQAYTYKRDSAVDLVAYLGALDNYMEYLKVSSINNTCIPTEVEDSLWLYRSIVKLLLDDGFRWHPSSGELRRLIDNDSYKAIVIPPRWRSYLKQWFNFEIED